MIRYNLFKFLDLPSGEGALIAFVWAVMARNVRTSSLEHKERTLTICNKFQGTFYRVIYSVHVCISRYVFETAVVS